jgi:N-acetylmuramoyl-L-alanine amidase
LTPAGTTREADLVLAVALAAKERLPELIITRCADTHISYPTRSRMLQAFGAHVVICGHCNWWTDPRRRGLRAFHYRGNGIMRRVARRAAINCPNELAPGRVICAQSKEGTEGTRYLTEIYPMDALVLEFGFLTNDQDRTYLISPPGVDGCADLVVDCCREYEFILTGKKREVEHGESNDPGKQNE